MIFNSLWQFSTLVYVKKTSLWRNGKYIYFGILARVFSLFQIWAKQNFTTVC